MLYNIRKTFTNPEGAVYFLITFKLDFIYTQIIDYQ
jgi:hypothetical protein